MLILFSMHNRLFLALLGCLSLGVVLSSEVQASTSLSNADSVDPSASHVLVLFEPPTDEKVDNSRGGASRPAAVKCRQDEAYGVPMTALIPQSGVGLTAAAHPTLLVYVPPTTATQAHLTLRDANQVGRYQDRVQIPQTGGIISIDLPADSPALAVGETYHWSLALLCQPTQTDIPITSGQIRRVELSHGAGATVTEQPEQPEQPGQPSLSQAITYGQSGVWHDMLATLAALRQMQPENNALNANWTELLQAENLGAIANTPLLD